MKKATARKSNGLRREYDLTKLKGGVRGKYFRRYSEGTNLVLLDPDIADAFPDAKAVNDALRVLVNVASTRVRPSRRGKRA
jgi:hypothetical protein